MPCSGTFCGFSRGVVRDAHGSGCGPFFWGVNVTLMVHCWPEFRPLPQLLVWVNGPLTVIPLMVRVLPPVLVNVTGCAGLVVRIT